MKVLDRTREIRRSRRQFVWPYPHAGGYGRVGGVVVGTPAYMSPEQARGFPVDKRSDIWAFGCLLYEMLTGGLAFAGDTVSDTIAKVLEREPDWRRCLSRRQSRFDGFCCGASPKIPNSDCATLAMRGSRSTRSARRCPTRQTRPRRARAPHRAVRSGCRGLPSSRSLRRSSRCRPDAVPPPSRTLSRTPGSACSRPGTGPRASPRSPPDGKFVIFVADHERRFDLWRSQVGTGVFVNLGQNMPPQRPPGILHRAFGFTADGSEIWFSETGDALGRKLLMPMTGGAPRPFLNPRQTAPAWSPDGQQLAYMTIPTELESGDPLSVADGSGANPRTIIFPEPKVHIHNPTWSPDGQWIYFVRGTDPTGSMDVWRIRPSGGASEQLTHQRAAVNFLAPLDARTALYVARAADWSGPWLWSLDVQTKTTRRVSVGLPQYISVAASRDGRRVVATVAHPTASLWKVPLLDGAAGEADVQPYRSRCRPIERWARASGERLSSTCRAAEPATGCGSSRADKRPKSGETWVAH